MKSHSENFKKIFILLTLISVALVERLWFDLGDNVELVTLAALVASFYLGKKQSFIVTLTILAISDIFLGNTSIALFTWTGYAAIVFGASFIKSFAQTPFKKIIAATGAGIIASVWFYLWTNFGVWFLDSWGMYANDITGLTASYINGLPFLRNQLVGNFIIIPLVFLVIEGIKLLVTEIRKSFLIKTNITL